MKQSIKYNLGVSRDDQQSYEDEGEERADEDEQYDQRHDEEEHQEHQSNPYDEVPVGGGRNRQLNAYEERENMPVGGNRNNRSQTLNPFEARENMPVGGGGRDGPNEMFLEDGAGLDDKLEAEAKNKKREFLKKKAKYDPRKAIEDSKKKQDDE